MFRRVITITTISGALAACYLTGCAASQPTKNLVDAREAYRQAARGPASKVAPQHLYEAKQALDKAEAVHQEEPGSRLEQHYGYLAQRQAQLADAEGQIEVAKQAQAQAKKDYVTTQERLRQRVSGELSDAEESLEDARQAGSELREERGELQSELSKERQERLEAEKRAAAAMESLKQVAQVKEEANRTVITLSGAVLFKTGESSLLPVARNSLQSVADALEAQGDSKTIVIEGHTDSRGASDMNQELSRRRAESVRDYLVEHGTAQERITVVGRGESQPIADNGTPEGRANNRRVEIILQDSGS